MTVRIAGIAKPRFAPALQVVRWCFLAVGLLAISYCGYAYAARSVYQAYGTWTFDRAATHQGKADLRKLKVRDPSLIGRISIARLNIDAIVQEGVDDDVLALAVGHVPSTPVPGSSGNVAFSAHRDTFFRNLKDVRRDDEIIVTTDLGSYLYRVKSYKVVQPVDVSVLASLPGENTLTLVTCYPFYFVGPAPKRFVVRAQLVSTTPRAAAD
jgi:sortase A